MSIPRYKKGEQEIYDHIVMHLSTLKGRGLCLYVDLMMITATKQRA